MAGTAVSKIAELQVKGGRLEWWRFTLNPAQITGDAQVIDTVAIPGAKAGDPVRAEPEAPEAGLNVQGCKVTADNEVSLYLTSSVTLDSAALTYNLEILKRTVVAA